MRIRILVFSLLLVGLWTGCGQKASVPADPQPTTQPAEPQRIAQSVTRRTWKHVHAEELPLSDRFARHIYAPNWLKIYRDMLFVVDWGDVTIKRFTLDGILETVYGKDKGQGPGEIQGIFDWHVQPDSQLFIIDLNTRKFYAFDGRGVPLRTVALQACLPYRMAGLNARRLVLWCLMSDPMFLELTPEGEEVRRFGKILDEHVEHAYLALEGRMFSRPEGGFVFVPRLASYLYFFDAEGVLETIVRTLDGLEYPLDRLKKSRVSADDLVQPVHQYVIHFTEDAFWLQVGIRPSGGGKRVWAWDRYDRQTMQYTYSIEQPISGWGGWYQDRLYVAEDTTIRVFQLQIEE